MTPEERFIKIENSLNTVAEHQAQMVEHQVRHEKAIQELTEMHKGVVIIVGKIAEAQQVTDLKLNTLTEKMNTLTETVNAHAEQQRVTEDKLHALIDTVDRIIRSQGGDR